MTALPNDQRFHVFAREIPATPLSEEYDEAVVSRQLMLDPVQQRMLVILLAVMIVTPLVFLGLLRLNDSDSATAVAQNRPAVVNNVEAIAEPVSAAAVEQAPEGIGGSELAGAGGALSPVFTREVRHWEPQILQWAAAYDLDPNLVAIIMQVESCGDPGAQSGAGAQGLFQVMPFHFTAGEQMKDPDTNARRGLNYFVEGIRYHNGDIGKTFAGYNGGHGTSAKSWSAWPAETQRYYTWTTGILEDIQAGRTESPTLQAWLDAGGSGLCRQAAGRLGL